MTYRVVYTDSFLHDVADQVGHMRSQNMSDRTIRRWYDRLLKDTDTLEVWPRVYPVDDAYTVKVGWPTHKIRLSGDVSDR